MLFLFINYRQTDTHSMVTFRVDCLQNPATGHYDLNISIAAFI